jgi:tripartite-type tricarboxylate transporter receptor subunit TctC
MKFKLSEASIAGALDRVHLTKHASEACALLCGKGRRGETLLHYFGWLAGAVSFVGMGLVGALPAAAQEPAFPKVVKIVVPFSPAGSNDLFARALAQRLSLKLGIIVMVDNKPGAGGSIGADVVARAEPDGSTLLLSSASFATNAAVKTNLPFDPIASFAPVALVAKGPMVLIVGSKAPYTTIAQLLAATKDPKNIINYSSAGVGSIGQLSVELFKSMSATSALHVPYPGINGAVTNMIGGRIDYMITTSASVGGQLKGGQVRPIAVTSLQSSKFFPGVPVIAESIPGYSVDVWWAVFAPAKTPKAVVERLNAAIRSVSNQPDMLTLFAQEGSESTTLTADETASYVVAEVNKWKRVAREGNIAAD